MGSKQQKRLAMAGAALLVLVVAAAWIASRDRTTTLVSSLLYPELAGSLPGIQRVLIETAEEQPAVELVRDGERWSVAQREGYTADVGKIGVLLQELAELKVLEAKTSTPSSYPALGVEDLSTPGAPGLRVKAFTGTVNPPVIDLIVGNNAGGETTYVRKADEAASWLVNRIAVARLPGAWLEPAITHVDTDRIHQVVLRPVGKPALTITKPGRGNADFAIAGRTLTQPKAANGISTGLIALQLDDVRKADTLPGTPAITATYRLFDGLVLDIAGWREGDQHWITVAPSFDAELARRFANDKPQDNTGTAFWRTPEQVQQELERLTPRVSGWAFRVPQYKYQGIFPDTDAWVR